VLFTSKAWRAPRAFPISLICGSVVVVVHGVHDVAELRVDGTSGQIRMND
jgi:hypothetical protein